MLGSIAITNAWVVFSRPLWLDEYHTVLLASEPGVPELLRDLGQGADFSPPLLFLAMHGVSLITGELSPTTIRVFSFVAVWLGLSIIYAIVRQRRDRIVALGTAFLLWTSPVIVGHAFEGRFYAFWFLLAAAFAALLLGASTQPASRLRLIGIAVVAPLLCTIHYFGIITWVLACTALLPFFTKTAGWKTRLAAGLTGPLALGAVIPLYLGQRAVLGSTTWIQSLSFTQVQQLFGYLVFWPPLLGLILFRRYVDERSGRASSIRALWQSWTPTEMGLVAFVMLVGFLIAFSVIIQPVGIVRYGVPAALAWVPIASSSLDHENRRWRMVAVVAVFGFSLVTVGVQRRNQGWYRDQFHEDAAALAGLAASGLPLVAVDRHALYPLAHADTLAGVSIRLVDLGDPPLRTADGQLVALNGFETTERLVAQTHTRLFSFPVVVRHNELSELDAFVLFAWSSDVPAIAATWFPQFTRRMITDRIYELRRSAG